MKDPLMRFHRLLWETEDSNRANQLDKLVQILKDRPIKYSLAKNPAPVLPPLSVVRKVQRKEMIQGGNISCNSLECCCLLSIFFSFLNLGKNLK